MAQITIYGTRWCADCRRTKRFLDDRGVSYREINIDDFPEAEDVILQANNGRRKVPTIYIDGRYFACSPFDPYQLAKELNIPLQIPNIEDEIPSVS